MERTLRNCVIVTIALPFHAPDRRLCKTLRLKLGRGGKKSADLWINDIFLCMYRLLFVKVSIYAKGGNIMGVKSFFTLLIVSFLMCICPRAALSDGADDDITAGTSAQVRGNFDEAIRFYSKAIKSEELKDNTIIAYVNRGKCYEAKGLLDNAIDDYTKAISLEMNNALHFTSRGAAYLKKGYLDRAIDDFSEAIRLNPDNIYAYKNRAIAYEKKGLRAYAAEDLKKVEQMEPAEGKKPEF
jgi:tetratricopeptide (TPR) repeat protein